MLNPEKCRKQLFNIGIKLGVSPRLISTRLLSTNDKEDMLSGLISDHELELHVKVWMEHQMPDYANGSNSRYKTSCELPMQRRRGNGSK